MDYNSPIIITGTAGSGTRIFCDILEKLGIHMGSYQNPQKDNKFFIEIIKDGIPIANPSKLTSPSYLSSITSPDFYIDILDSKMQDHVRNRIEIFSRKVLKDRPNQFTKWGWKESQSMFVLPFLFEVFPNMSIIHVVRDGRDIAFSKQQRAKYQASYVKIINNKFDVDIDNYHWPVFVAKSWEIVNLAVTIWISRNIDSSRYLLVKLEDLIHKRDCLLTSLSRFIGLTNISLNNVIENSLFNRNELRIGKYKSSNTTLVQEIEKSIYHGLSCYNYI